VWVNRWFAITTELRDYFFADELENLTVALPPADKDPSTWYDPKSYFTNNVQAQVGASIFIPFSFDYRLPK